MIHSIIITVLIIAGVASIIWVFVRAEFPRRDDGKIDQPGMALILNTRVVTSIIFASAITLVLLSLAGFLIAPDCPLQGERSKSTIVIGVDVSQSMRKTGALALAEDSAMRIWRSVGGGSSLVYSIAFGTAPRLVDLEAKAPFSLESQSPDFSGSTNIGAVLRMASCIALSADEKKVVLLSDGRENAGNAFRQALLLGQIDVPVFPLILPARLPKEEPRAYSPQTALSAQIPLFINEGEPFTCRLLLPSDFLLRTGTRRGSVRVTLDGENRDEYPVVYDVSKPLFSKAMIANGVGVHYIEFVFDTGGKVPYIFTGYYTVLQRAEILLMENNPSGLAEALSGKGMHVEERSAETFLKTIDRLSRYDAVVINDLPPAVLSADAEMAMRDFVTIDGKGLLYLFGPRNAQEKLSESLLDEILPLAYDEKDTSDSGSISLMIVVDNSGSMSDVGLDKAVKTLLTSWKGMRQVKEIGICGFDTKPHWITPDSNHLVPFTSAQSLLTRLDALGAGGGGILVDEAVPLGYNALVHAKHSSYLLLVTDLDDAEESDQFPALARDAFNHHKIRTNILAIGEAGSYRTILQQAASAGKGNYKEISKTGDDLARLAWKGRNDENLYRKGNRSLRFAARQSFLAGIPDTLPPVPGYIPMKPKEGACSVIDIVPSAPKKGTATPQSALACWQKKRGRVVMSCVGIEDTQSQWASWRHRDQVWSQAIRWTIAPYSKDPFACRIVNERDGLAVFLERNDDYVITVPKELRIEFNGGTRLVPVEESRIDVYRAIIGSMHAGPASIGILDDQGNEVQSIKVYLGGTTTSVSTGDIESGGQGIDSVFLQRIAALSGGEMGSRTLNVSSPLAVTKEKKSKHFPDLWRWMLLVAMLLYWWNIFLRSSVTCLKSFRNISDVFKRILKNMRLLQFFYR
jgi:Ca-activated chloride channel homolog